VWGVGGGAKGSMLIPAGTFAYCAQRAVYHLTPNPHPHTSRRVEGCREA